MAALRSSKQFYLTMKTALRVLAIIGFPFFIFYILWFVWEVAIIGKPSETEIRIADNQKKIDSNFKIIDSLDKQISSKEPVIDSLFIKVQLSTKYLDSNLYYYHKSIDYKGKRDEMEILYLRTEEDRYRVKGNHYANLAYKYGMIANKWYDSLQMNAK